MIFKTNLAQVLDVEIYVPNGASIDYSAKRIQVLDDVQAISTRIEANLDCAGGRVLVSGNFSAPPPLCLYQANFYSCWQYESKTSGSPFMHEEVLQFPSCQVS